MFFKNSKKWLSIIIPIRNGEKTLDKLIQSILNQKIKKSEYEIIFVDDKSTDNSLKIIEKYNRSFDYKICETEREIHCPGNTRNVGLENATGQWITFIDQDDWLEENALAQVKKILKEKKYTLYLNTKFKAYENNTEKVIGDFGDDLLKFESWLHGKFYNRENLIEKYNIRFKEDFAHYEDLYFVFRIDYALSKEFGALQKHLHYEDIYTYHYNHNLESEGQRKVDIEDSDLKYTHIEYYLPEYLFAHLQPMVDSLDYLEFGDDISYVIKSMPWVLLGGFFHMELMKKHLLYQEQFYCERSLKALKEWKEKILQYISKEEILSMVYTDVNGYFYTLQSMGELFVETISFRDFILED